METNQEKNQDLDDRLKAALWFNIGKIVDEETFKLGTNATPQFIGSLTEMVWAQIQNISLDLESFAKHAGRTTISTDDVMLLARRNESLATILRNALAAIEASKNNNNNHNKKAKSRK